MGDFEARRSAFSRWRCAPLGELLGSGRYASVYACGEGAAAKVMDLSGKSRRSRMQAYREHVVSIMQTLLLLQGVTLHFPFHYGLTVAVAKPGLSLTLFMERFSGNLLETAGAAWMPASRASTPTGLSCRCSTTFSTWKTCAALVFHQWRPQAPGPLAR